jgi:hypothetical protein
MVVQDGLIFPEHRDVEVVVPPAEPADGEIDRPAAGESPRDADLRHCLHGPGHWREIAKPIRSLVE